MLNYLIDSQSPLRILRRIFWMLFFVFWVQPLFAQYEPNNTWIEWIQPYDQGVGGDDRASAIAIDNSGYVYVTGESYGGTETGFDYATIKYSQYICGDANYDTKVTVSDVVYIMNYIMDNEPPPTPFLSGNADGCGTVDIADVVYLVQYLFRGGPVPANCDNTSDWCEIIREGNNVSQGHYSLYPDGDSLKIPIYISNSDSLGGFTLGFHYTTGGIEITSVNTSGTILPIYYQSYLESTFYPGLNQVLVGWWSYAGPLAPQSGGLLLYLNAQFPSGNPPSSINLVPDFVSPAGYFIFAPSAGGIIHPEFYVCSGGISGIKFNDVNENCVRDSGEVGLPGWMITLDPGGWTTLTDANGDYSFSCLPPNTYTISEVVKTYWEQTCPAPPGTYEVVLDTGQTITDLNFGNKAIPSQDLSVDVAGGVARPGFQKSYGIKYENKGTVSTNGTVILTLPSEVSHIGSYCGGVYDPGTHSVTWDVGSLAPGFMGWLCTKVQIPSTIPIGTTLTSVAQINPIAGDANPADNVDPETQTVRGSCDPNEKLATPEYAILKTDTLRYQINFQNVGTDTAFNILVRDILDNNLDITTLESGASSHPYVFSISGRELSWTFANINLPDSIVDEPGSHGFVTFKVQPRSDVAFGAEIENNAAIYFDFNPPVITNTVRNRIYTRGDVNSDWKLNVSDIIYLINYLFKGGPPPVGGLMIGDVNCDGKVTVSDVVYLINYLFKGGPPPC